MEDLAARVAREKAAYDDGAAHRESSALQARFYHVFQCPNTRRAEDYLDQSVERWAKGKDILDYGCGDGWMTPRYQKMAPASITGLDVSEACISKASASFGDIAKFHAGDAHAMPFADASFDLVVGRSILHHLDLELALREIHRVLRPSGKAVFMEPLGDNPGAKILRALTPRARTADEKPLTRTDIQRADAVFGSSEHFFYNFASVPVAMATSLTPLSPNCALLKFTDQIDQLLAHTFAKYWMRQVVLVWQKS